MLNPTIKFNDSLKIKKKKLKNIINIREYRRTSEWLKSRPFIYIRNSKKGRKYYSRKRIIIKRKEEQYLINIIIKSI